MLHFGFPGNRKNSDRSEFSLSIIWVLKFSGFPTLRLPGLSLYPFLPFAYVSFSCLILEVDNVAAGVFLSDRTIAVGFWDRAPRPFIFQNGSVLFCHSWLSLKDHCNHFADKNMNVRKKKQG